MGARVELRARIVTSRGRADAHAARARDLGPRVRDDRDLVAVGAGLRSVGVAQRPQAPGACSPYADDGARRGWCSRPANAVHSDRRAPWRRSRSPAKCTRGSDAKSRCVTPGGLSFRAYCPARCPFSSTRMSLPRHRRAREPTAKRRAALTPCICTAHVTRTAIGSTRASSTPRLQGIRSTKRSSTSWKRGLLRRHMQSLRMAMRRRRANLPPSLFGVSSSSQSRNLRQPGSLQRCLWWPFRCRRPGMGSERCPSTWIAWVPPWTRRPPWTRLWPP